jgi:23S rRNA-/tRNA-specific pseudouridylate synthase
MRYILKLVCYIRHAVLRTEPPVTAQKIKIVHEDDEILIVDKPASIPVRYIEHNIYFIIIFMVYLCSGSSLRSIQT